MGHCRSSFFSLSCFFYFIVFSLCALPLQAYHYYSVSLSGAEQKKASAIYIRTANPLDAAWFPENIQIDVWDVQRANIDLSTSLLFRFDGGIYPHEMDDPAYNAQLALAIRAVLLTMADRRFHPVHSVDPHARLSGNQQDLAVPVYQYGNLARNLNDIGGLAEQLQQEGLIVDWHFRGLSFIDEARVWVRIRVSVNDDNNVADHHGAVLGRFRDAFPSMAIRYRSGLLCSQNFERAEPVRRSRRQRFFDPGSVSNATVTAIEFYLNAEEQLAWESEGPQVQAFGHQLYTFLVRFHVNANELNDIEPLWLSNITSFTREIDIHPSTRLLRWMLVRISRDAVRDGHLALTFRMDISADPYEVNTVLFTHGRDASDIFSWSQLNIDLHTTRTQPEQDINPGCLQRLIGLFRRQFRQLFRRQFWQLFRRQFWQPEELSPLSANPQLDSAREFRYLDAGSSKMQ